MTKRKKTGKTPAVSAADIVTPTDEVLAYPEQPQEIPDPEKTQPVNGEAKPFLGVFAEECNGPGEPPNMNAGPALPWPELEAEEKKPKFDLDENLYQVVVSQEAVRADIETEHAGITLQDTDILADADGCEPGDFVVDPLWTDAPNLQPSEPEPPRPSPRGSDYVPPVGSWWSMPTSEPYALTVIESPNDGLVRCRDYVRRDGFVFTGVTKITLDDFRVGLLVLELCCPEWITSGREFETKKDPKPGVSKPINDWFPSEQVQDGTATENGAAEVANELGVEVRDVQLIVDSALHAVASVFSLKSIASCSPVFDSALRLMASDGAAAVIVRLLREVSPNVFREAFHEAARTYMVEYDQDQKYLKSNLQEHRESIDGELSGIRSAVTTLDENIVRHIKLVVARIEKLERNQSEVSSSHSAGGILSSEVVVERLNCHEDRIDGLIAAFENHVAKCSAPDVVDSADPLAIPKGLFVFIQNELNPIREDMASLQDRQDLVERKRLMADDQKRKNQKAHHESMKKPKAEQLEVRRARDKTARELKTVEAEKVGEIKRGRGRPRKVDVPPKATAKPIVVPVDLVAGMMKKSPDKKVEKLLRGLDAKQLKRIADQLPKGLPDVSKIPGWVEADRFAFVRWYFGQSGN